MALKIECVLACENHLGEGPVWDVGEGRLYWVDGTGRRVGKPSIWRLDPRTGKVENWSLDRDVGAMALRRDGGAVLALDDGFYFFDFASGKLDLIQLVDAEQPRTRLNDGKCDRRGRFYAGGMDDKEELAICGLYRLDPSLRVTKVDSGIICSNGPCWSPDDRTFYFADTFQGEYWAYDFDIATGSLANKRVFASFKGDGGVADGSTIDDEGCVWNAQLISGELVRYAPDGSVERRIGMPVRPSLVSVVLLLSVLGVSLSGPLVRLSNAHPVAIAIWRLTFSLAIIAVPVLARGSWKQWRTLDARSFTIAVVGGVMLALHFWSWNTSVGLTTM